jgi:exopolysaccharide production protein ExoZ
LDQITKTGQSAVPIQAPSSSGKTFLTIQALRALAAIMVVVHHLLTVIKGNSSHQGGPQWMGGTTGVDIFFVISGFVMMTSSGSLPREHAARTFLLRRFQRIAPPYWALTTLKVLLLLAVPAISMKGLGSHWHIVSSYLFLPAANGGDNFPVLIAGWTLTFEMLFYLLFAAALVFRAQFRVHLMSFLACMICTIAAGGVLIQPGGPALLTVFDPIVLEFLYGVTLGHAVLANRLPRPSVCLGLLVSGYACLLWLAPNQSLWIRPIASGLPAFAVVTGAVGLERYVRSRTPLWVTELGNSSYSLYLTHGLLIPFFVVILRKIQLTGHLATLLFLVLGTLVCLAVGELFYRWFELPMMRFFRSARHREPRLLQGLDGAKAETM